MLSLWLLFPRYYLAEGFVCGHEIFIISRNKAVREVIQHLPKPVSSEKESSQAAGDMNIAFRYKYLPRVSTSFSSVSKYGHNYDISKTMERSLIEAGNFDVLNLWDDKSFHEKTSLDLFRYANIIYCTRVIS